MLARDVAYELIPFFQRRALHAKLAEALEGLRSGAGGEDPPVAASTIAYHWQQSCATAEVAEWRRAMKVRLGPPQGLCDCHKILEKPFRKGNL